MGKSHIRKDKTCLNCHHVVEKRFCGNCGQENIETRKTFHHLFVHFFEDLTHYENAFWKTIRNLLFKPSSLSTEYLSGKRMSYLAPVRLYIFISFITFLLIAILPSKPEIVKANVSDKVIDTIVISDQTLKDQEQLKKLLQKSGLSKTEKKVIEAKIFKNFGTTKSTLTIGFKSVEEFDSIHKYGNEKDKVPVIFRKYLRKSIENSEKFTLEEMKEKLSESILHNFPKVLLIYMPIFAFFLWLLHNKKKWYYFDHGIFTLHYFSFLLLISLLLFLLRTIFDVFGSNEVLSFIHSAITVLAVGWMIYYFFPAHHRFYGNSRFVSFVKSIVLLFINLIIMTVLFLSLFIYSYITLH
ncbi:DUF3667 domain-containing protein [Flavobacterium antarcticum]|uniref:DUF3667 domain-containing protein n=1 Tax=Flavobacterium antarcticum TaxID=271155 RepID=UPI0003B69248|nr:DUF3667 domain-containing protein [Flavobacterium antarcticum]